MHYTCIHGWCSLDCLLCLHTGEMMHGAGLTLYNDSLYSHVSVEPLWAQWGKQLLKNMTLAAQTCRVLWRVPSITFLTCASTTSQHRKKFGTNIHKRKFIVRRSAFIPGSVKRTPGEIVNCKSGFLSSHRSISGKFNPSCGQNLSRPRSGNDSGSGQNPTFPHSGNPVVHP